MQIRTVCKPSLYVQNPRTANVEVLDFVVFSLQFSFQLSRSRILMYDENSVHGGKLPVAGGNEPKFGATGNQVLGKSSVGLKQQTTTSERRILSDISNTKAPSLNSLNTPRPSPKPGFVPFKENVPKSGNVAPKASLPQPKNTSESSQKAEPRLQHLRNTESSQKAGPRIPLRDIVNQSTPASKGSTTATVQQEPRLKSGGPRRFGSKATARIRLTDEELRLADEWAKEDISLEQIHFSGDDMEALRQKMIEAEIEETVAAIRNYRGGPLPSATDKPSEETVEDSLRYADGRLKLDSVQDEIDHSALKRFESLFMEDDSEEHDPILKASSISTVWEEDYPSIPENWRLREDLVTSL
ncbi:hypothetical protein R1flu_009957 [Riccia fluitans]|uniref:Uncharacterized protein n=1 Tax=Riccia fluitans TaxID=41844 RepID=A0ABD1Z3T5_9MARC